MKSRKLTIFVKFLGDLFDRMIFVKKSLFIYGYDIIEVAHFLCGEIEDVIHIYKDFLNEFKRVKL